MVRVTALKVTALNWGTALNVNALNWDTRTNAGQRQLCVFFTLNRSFHPSIPDTRYHFFPSFHPVYFPRTAIVPPLISTADPGSPSRPFLPPAHYSYGTCLFFSSITFKHFFPWSDSRRIVWYDLYNPHHPHHRLDLAPRVQ